MDNPVAKALHDGLDRLRERGLAKNKLCDSQGRVCARGALIDAVGLLRNNLEWDAVAAAADTLLEEVAWEQYRDRCPWGRSTTAFNNHPDTTQEDVERVFEKAIIKAYETL